MIFNKNFALVLAAGLTLGGTAVAQEDPAEMIAAKLPGIEAADIDVTDSPIAGMYEIGLGTQVAYISKDARYLVRGDIIDLDSNVNLTDARRSDARSALLAGVGNDQMIVFSPEGEVKHSITVFTDIDCGYCRKLHREMADLNERGIEVRYAFFPRSGPNTASWNKAENVWCSADRNDALTRAKLGEEIEAPKECAATPVASHYEMGRQVGVSGTPAIVAGNGTLIAGYLPAERLLARLDSIGESLSAAR